MDGTGVLGAHLLDGQMQVLGGSVSGVLRSLPHSPVLPLGTSVPVFTSPLMMCKGDGWRKETQQKQLRKGGQRAGADPAGLQP